MAGNPALLKAVFSDIYPNMEEVLLFYEDGFMPDNTPVYMAFEWIGKESSDYLGEHAIKKGPHTRGANFTSADFAFRFKRKDGNIEIVLGEWKYTEEYGYKDYLEPKSIKDKKPEARNKTYREAFYKSGGIIKNRSEELYRGLFLSHSIS
jgi:hypothetical protein